MQNTDTTENKNYCALEKIKNFFLILHGKNKITYKIQRR